jgi:creatinine amidohydrolase
MVHMQHAADVADVTVGRIWSYDMGRTTRTGVVGRPTEASPADGAAMAAIMVEDLAALIRVGLAEGWPELPP